MKLVPAVIDIENPRAGQTDALSNGRGGEVATIARHELDNQVPTAMGCIYRVGENAISIQSDVQITIQLMAEPHDRS